VTTGLGKVLGLGRTKNKEDVKAMTREQVSTFFRAAITAAGDYYAILFTMYQTGMRLGEARGLYTDDLRLDKLEAHVQRTLDDQTDEEGLPKGGKERTVDLSDQLVECHKRYKAKRAEWALAGGWGQSVPYFFVTTNGTPIGPDEIRKVFKRVLKAAELPRYFTPHSLRHTYASLLLQEDGGRLLYVSCQLGHANVSITADTYAKWIRPVGQGVVNTLALSSVV
jgi:integrase